MLVTEKCSQAMAKINHHLRELVRAGGRVLLLFGVSPSPEPLLGRARRAALGSRLVDSNCRVIAASARSLSIKETFLKAKVFLCVKNASHLYLLAASSSTSSLFRACF